MSIVQKCISLPVEDYLEGECHSDVRHELVAGQVYAMVGASSNHNLIAGNIFSALHAHLRGKPCQAFMSDMKVRVANDFYYPDVMVSCDPADRHDYYREKPVLVIEVLSPATEGRDSLEKRIAYQSLPSLQEYVLVAQDKTELCIYRNTGNGWLREICRAGDQVTLQSVGLNMPIEAIFEDVPVSEVFHPEG